MTLSPPAVLLGDQAPRVSNYPAFSSSSGAEAIELAESAGVFLFPWQKHVIEVMLGERADGKWSSYELGFLVARQNGKGEILLVRELAGLFLLGERLLLHSAHEFKTSKEAFLRIKGVIEATPHLASRVKQFYQSNQETAIELKSTSPGVPGARLRFMARSRQSGRGFSAQTLLMDEAQEMSESARAALLFTTAAQSNPQLIYTGTVPTAETVNSEVFTSIRDRGRAGNDPQLAWLEYSIDPGTPKEPIKPDLDDQAGWLGSNPSAGPLITLETIARERLSTTEQTFLEERLSYWPGKGEDAMPWNVVGEADYIACDAGEPEAPWLTEPTALSVEMTQDRQWITVVAAGTSPDGPGATVVLREPNGPAALDAIATLALSEERPIAAVVIDPRSQAGSLIPDLEDLGVVVLECPTNDLVKATGSLLDAMRAAAVKFRRSSELDSAVALAETRKYGEAELIDRWGPGDPTPLIGVALARFGVASAPEPSDGPVAFYA